MRALSVRQPFAELILRGVKTREYRTLPTRRIGERFYLYATKGGRTSAPQATTPKIWSADLGVPEEAALPAWMIELAEQLMRVELPRGLIVGTAVIEQCTGPVEAREPGGRAYYHWHLADVERLAEPIKPKRHPQPVWFRPF